MAAKPSLNDAQILVVDDEPDLRTLYELALLREGYNVTGAGGLAEAEEQLQQRRFDVVIIDPPAFIKRRKDIPKGEAAYKRLNQLAMQLLEREGVLVSCSCSYHLQPDSLVTAIQRAARHVGRFVQIVEVGGQAPDHPIHPAIPETRYLKAYFCRAVQD